MIYSSKLTLQDLDDMIAALNKKRSPAQVPPIYLGEFGWLAYNIEFMQPTPRHSISSWYFPKRVLKILAEGRIGRKESGLRLVVYRSTWVSRTGVVQFIGSSPEHALVSHTGKRFRYELYDGTKLLAQTNSLETALNHPFLP
jgi:hypothetical protein